MNKKVFLIGPIQRPNYMFPQNLSRLIKFNHIEENQMELEATKYDMNYIKLDGNITYLYNFYSS